MTQITNSTEETIAYLRNSHLLMDSKMCCQERCSELKCKTSDGKEFRCKICHKRYIIRTGSIFFDVHIPIRFLLLLTYLFATQTSVTLASRYLGRKVSAKSISMWYDQMRIVMSDFLTANPEQLGGPDSVVEIDKTCLGRKRKYNRGAMRGQQPQWALGIIDRNSKKVHIQLVERRTRDILLPIIEQHVPNGTVIHTDEAPVYAILTQRGFEHYTVCHRDEYVAHDGTHTNCIENVWCHLKNTFKEKHGVLTDKIAAHVDEFLYRWNQKDDAPMYELLLRDIRAKYPL